MPDRVFDIIRVDGLVELELLDTFFVFVGVVVGNASLPVMRLLIRVKLNKSIEIESCQKQRSMKKEHHFNQLSMSLDPRSSRLRRICCSI